MQPHSHPATWITAIAWLCMALAASSALAIVVDIVRGHRQKMAIMNVVYPITALYWGPAAAYQYFTRGRRDSSRMIARYGEPDKDDQPRWWAVFKGVSHCGAGCTLGDIAGEATVALTGFTVLGTPLVADFVVDFPLAWALGIVFQYFTIVPMRDVGTLGGIWAAVKADTLSIVAFQAGLFGGMAIYQRLIFSPPLAHHDPVYWMMMQLAMILGSLTAYPMNRWLLSKGLKEAM